MLIPCAPGYSSFENTPWIERLVAYTQSVLKQDRVRLVGVCFGHQIIGRAMGVEVGRNSRGWEVSVCDVDLTAEGKRVFRVEKLVCSQFFPTLRICCACLLLVIRGTEKSVD